MRELVFLLEERSAKEMLEGLLPRMLPEELRVRYLVFKGKQDLERNIPVKLRAYLNPQARFIIIRDQDSAPDWRSIKDRILALCEPTGKTGVIVRIACRELESFYLADLAAVEKGLGLPGLAKHQNRKKYRSPDYLECPSRELETLTQGHYRKVGGSRAIGSWLDPENTRSCSFRSLMTAIRRVAVAAVPA